ncbi:MAG: hypothetical protein LBT76_00110 [Tannerella sp.]|jgi:hypothetical protein|nr:hypothetical protein [Tannerella sp.]
MTTNDYIPQAYSALLSWGSNFVTYLNANLDRFGITSTAIAPLVGKYGEYVTSNSKAESANAGKADRLNREEDARDLKRIIRDLVNQCLRYNPEVTDEDRINLGLHVPDDNPTPKPKPTTQIEATIDPSIIMQLTLRYRNAGSQSHAKPDGVHGAEIRWNILATPPASTEDLIHSEFSTRSPHTFTFDEDRRGKTVYFRLRWENTRGQKGPWSELYSAIIP